mgnify:CR=1 FL=1
MEKTGQEKFIDPDFGPLDENDKAPDDIYFEDIPSGCPNPDEMVWLRPD